MTNCTHDRVRWGALGSALYLFCKDCGMTLSRPAYINGMFAKLGGIVIALGPEPDSVVV